MADKLFRIILQVDDLDKAEAFYGKLLNDPGRRIPYASRHYIDCGPVILALVDPTPGGEPAKPLPDNIYFAVADLEGVLLEQASWDVFHRMTSMARVRVRSSVGPGASAHFMFMIRGATAFVLWTKKRCLPVSQRDR